MPSLMGRKINELRRQNGLTLDQLAQATDSSKSYMWEIENKEVARPSGEKLNRIAAALGVTPEFLADPDKTEATRSDMDEAFYRKFENLTDDKKQKLSQILDILDGDA